MINASKKLRIYTIEDQKEFLKIDTDKFLEYLNSLTCTTDLNDAICEAISKSIIEDGNPIPTCNKLELYFSDRENLEWENQYKEAQTRNHCVRQTWYGSMLNWLSVKLETLIKWLAQKGDNPYHF